jgi:peroxiredoxin
MIPVRVCVAILVVVSMSLAMAGWAGDRLEFEASEPELLPDPDWGPYLLSEEGYEDFAEGAQGQDYMVTLDAFPETAKPLLGYGFNFVYGGKNRSFAVFGSESEGYTLYADVDSDGSLADEAAWSLDSSEGRYAVDFETTDSGQAAGKPVAFPILSRFVIFPDGIDDSGSPAGVWHSETVRRGRIVVDGLSVPFELYGRAGRYDYPSQTIWFDLDADGEGGESRESPELFRNRDGYVNLGEQSYAFSVDPFGRHLELIPESERLPDRQALKEGHPAPDFQTTTIDDRSIRLADYKGKALLLYFWADWCGPCHSEAPRLAEIDSTWSDRGLQILGITTDEESTIEAFTSEHGQSWPQISEGFDGAVHRAYRVAAYPTKYLVDPRGNLLCGEQGPSFWTECWPKAEAVLPSGAD